ncbi:YggT family protein [soil metagenome]
MLQDIFNLIIDAVAGMLGGLLLLRFWMQSIRIRPPNSLGHFIFALTDWLVRPLRRLIPGVGGYDWASLLAAFLIAVLATLATIWYFPQISVQLVLVATLLRFVEWILYGFMLFILIEVVLSWVNPHAPLAPFIRALNDPLLRPLRRIIPLIGGIDLSSLVALLLLQILLKVAVRVIPLLA